MSNPFNTSRKSKSSSTHRRKDKHASERKRDEYQGPDEPRSHPATDTREVIGSRDVGQGSNSHGRGGSRSDGGRLTSDRNDNSPSIPGSTMAGLSNGEEDEDADEDEGENEAGNQNQWGSNTTITSLYTTNTGTLPANVNHGQNVRYANPVANQGQGSPAPINYAQYQQRNQYYGQPHIAQALQHTHPLPSEREIKYYRELRESALGNPAGFNQFLQVTPGVAEFYARCGQIEQEALAQQQISPFAAQDQPQSHQLVPTGQQLEQWNGPLHLTPPFANQNPGATHPNRRSSGQATNSRATGGGSSWKVMRGGEETNKFFKKRRVFIARWTEAAGENFSPRAPRNSGFSTTTYTQSESGSELVTEDRRFVLIQNHGHYSICIPIHTYGFRGCLGTRAIKAHEHSQIYSTDEPAPLQAGEAITKEAIRVILDRGQRDLHPLSRLNYGKLASVQHNIRVKPLGWIDEDDFVHIGRYLVATHRFG